MNAGDIALVTYGVYDPQKCHPRYAIQFRCRYIKHTLLE